MKTFFSYLVLVIAVGLMVLSSEFTWFNKAIVNQSNFVELSSRVFLNPDVKVAISNEIFDTTFVGKPLVKQVAIKTLKPTVDSLMNSEQYESLVRELSTGFHKLVVSENPQDVVLDISIFKTAITVISSITDSADVIGINPDEIPNEITLITAEQIPSLKPLVVASAKYGPLAGFIGIIILFITLVRAKKKAVHLKKIGVVMTIIAVLYLLAIPYFGNILIAASSGSSAQIIVKTAYEVFTVGLYVVSKNYLIAGIALIVLGFLLNKYGNLLLTTLGVKKTTSKKTKTVKKASKSTKKKITTKKRKSSKKK